MSRPAVGVDITSVSRVAALVERSPGFARRVFTERERAHCAGHPERWAGRWAAKEAVRKLAGGGGAVLPAFLDVEVAAAPDGAPVVTVRGWDVTVALSISHDQDRAIAVAMIVGYRDWPAPLTAAPRLLRLAARPGDAHKGSFGTVVVVGGAVGFGGAPYLAAMGAARAGAGLVRVCVPASIFPQVAAGCVEVMAHPLPDDDGGALAAGATEVLLQGPAAGATALVLGPGLTTGPETAAAVMSLLDRLPCPAVIDADALNIAAAGGFDWSRCRRPVILTPHPAEMGRLIGLATAEIQRDRIDIATAFARDHGVILVLKGSGTVVAAPDGRVQVLAGGLVSLATGGTGDVLAGIIGAMLAQGLEPFAAALAGACVHAEAGASVEATRGRAGGLAGDLLEALPAALERLRRALEAGS